MPVQRVCSVDFSVPASSPRTHKNDPEETASGPTSESISRTAALQSRCSAPVRPPAAALPWPPSPDRRPNPATVGDEPPADELTTTRKREGRRRELTDVEAGA